MRAYFFTNMYLSSIQQGIQPLHALAEMFNRYDTSINSTDARGLILREWSLKHKTVICLNGGYSSELNNLVVQFNTEHNPFPWASFSEDFNAIGNGFDENSGALTSVGIILPAEVYDLAKAMREGEFLNRLVIPSDIQWLAELLNRYGLAK